KLLLQSLLGLGETTPFFFRDLITDTLVSGAADFGPAPRATLSSRIRPIGLVRVPPTRALLNLCGRHAAVSYIEYVGRSTWTPIGKLDLEGLLQVADMVSAAAEETACAGSS